MEEYYKSNGDSCCNSCCCCKNFCTIIGPQGEKGEVGITGPIGITGPTGVAGIDGLQGLQEEKGEVGADGIQGKSAKLTVGVTETGDPGTEAIVNERIIDDLHYFDFKIPRGNPAPKNMLAIAQLYKTTADIIATADTELNFEIAQNFENALVTQKEIGVMHEGRYRIFYGLSPEIFGTATVALYNNGIEIPYSISKLTTAQPQTYVNLILLLSAGDTLSVRIKEITGTLTFSAGKLNAYLNVSPIS